MNILFRYVISLSLAAVAGAAMACPGDGGPTTGKCDVKPPPAGKEAGAASVNIGVGNPINVMTGNKYQREEDMAALPGVLGLEIVRHYNSVFSGNGAMPGLLGRGWKLSYETELAVKGPALQVFQADGSSLMFSRDLVNPARAVAADPANGSIAIRHNRQGGDDYVWRWTDGRELSFDTRGKLVQIKAVTGETVSLMYDVKGLLVKVTDPQGRSLRLVYPERGQGAGARFRGVRAIDSPVGRFEYDHDDAAGAAGAGQRARVANLLRVRYPGGTEGRQYHYEDAAHPSYLTGISIAGAGADGRPATWRYATYGYQADGKAVLSTHANGVDKVTVNYERPGKTTVTNSLGGQTVYRYATMADDYRLLEVRGAGCALCGPTNQRYSYDKLGRLTGTTLLDAQGMPLRQTQSELDHYGRVLRVSLVTYDKGRPGPAQPQARYEYGSLTATGPTLIARPSVVPGKEAVTRILYGNGRTAHLPVALRQTGFVPSFDGTGAADELRRATAYRYDANGHLVAHDGPLPNAGRNAGPANSDISLTEYDPRTGLPQRNVAPGNVVSEVLERDAALRPVRLRVTDGPIVQTTTTRYNWRGQPLEIAVEAYLADAAGKPDAATRQRRVRSYQYNAMGLLASTTVGGVLTTRIVYDAAGRPTHRILPDGSQVVVSQDSEGRKRSELRYAGVGDLRNRIDFQYDGASRLAQVRDSLGVLRSNSYDDTGRLAASSNALGVATRYEYDEQGLLARRIDADGTDDAAQIRLRHDILQQLTSVTDANGVVTERRYDDFGRKVMEANADRGVTLYRHDAAGRMVARVDQTGSTVRFTYDHANRLLALGADAQPALMHYRYQGTRLAEVLATPDGNPEHAKERTRYTYDALGQISEERQWLARVDAGAARSALRTVALKPAEGLNFVTRSSYDDAGRLVAQVLPDGHTLRYRYAPRGSQLREVLFDEQVVVGGIEQTVIGGTTAFTFGNGIRQRMRFDGRGRMTQLDAQRGTPDRTGWLDRLGGWWSDDRPAEPLVYRQDNRYDAAGRLVALDRAHGAAGTLPAATHRERFGYDAVNRLTSATIDGAAPQRYAYDRGGNRLGVESGAGTGLRYAYTAGTNRLQTISAAGGEQPQSAWLYHAAGMPLMQLSSATSGLRSLRIAYSAGRRPVAVYGADARPVARYAYGSLGQRLAKTVYGRDGAARTSYSLYREQRLAAETDADGRITTHYIYLYGKPVAKVDIVPDNGTMARLWHKVGGAVGAGGAGTVARLSAIHTDHLGVPQAMTDARQRIVWLARSDAFGAATVLYAAQVDGRRASMPLRLPGQVYDPETGLHQNYYRDYDPRTGRYTTVDPMGLEGGLNPYAYVSSNPLANIDPLGLYESDIHYYTTFVLAMAAGMSQADARMLALGTQYVDENPLTKPMPNGASPASMWKNAEALKKYHFVLDAGTPADAMMNPGSEQLSNLENAAATAAAAGNRNACLQLAGEFLHTFEDTFSHRDYNNVSFDPVVNINVIRWGFLYLTIEQKNLGLGHGLLAHDPDYTYNHKGNEWGEWTNEDGGTVRLFTPPHPVDWKVNESRTLMMEEATFNKLLAYGDPSKAHKWSEISELMAQFNAIKENESDTPKFTGKLAKLQEVLDKLKIEGVKLTGADAYSEAEAEANREANLKNLNPADYKGVILH